MQYAWTDARKSILQAGPTGLPPKVNLLLVNKTVYAEASAQFYQVNKFWLSNSFD